MKKIKQLLKNEVARKILVFFTENPHSIDTAKGISLWVDCNLETAQKTLKELAEHNILVNHKTASTNAYSYTTQKDTLKKIETYLKNAGYYLK